MRIALVSIVMISVLGVPTPAVAATGATGATAVGVTPAGFNICAMFPGLPWCPK